MNIRILGKAAALATIVVPAVLGLAGCGGAASAGAPAPTVTVVQQSADAPSRTGKDSEFKELMNRQFGSKLARFNMSKLVSIGHIACTNMLQSGGDKSKNDSLLAMYYGEAGKDEEMKQVVTAAVMNGELVFCPQYFS